MVPVALAVATSLGIGFAPFAPGTVGSFAGLLLWALLPTGPVLQMTVVGILFVVGAWSAGVAEDHFKQADPGCVVIDEVMGMLMTLTLNPVGWPGAMAGFVLFRLFDVIKPYPANRLERLPRGIGVMADDAMAAVYANLVLRVTVLGMRGLLGWSL